MQRKRAFQSHLWRSHELHQLICNQSSCGDVVASYSADQAAEQQGVPNGTPVFAMPAGIELFVVRWANGKETHANIDSVGVQYEHQEKSATTDSQPEGPRLAPSVDAICDFPFHVELVIQIDTVFDQCDGDQGHWLGTQELAVADHMLDQINLTEQVTKTTKNELEGSDKGRHVSRENIMQTAASLVVAYPGQLKGLLGVLRETTKRETWAAVNSKRINAQQELEEVTKKAQAARMNPTGPHVRRRCCRRRMGTSGRSHQPVQ